LEDISLITFSWPYIFYINIPIGIAATLMTLQFVRSPKYAEKRKVSDVDWIGIGLLAVTVGSLQFILGEVRKKTGLPVE
jgi:DHA2 family multidrug resistance protein